MLFNSLEFILFLLVVLPLYFGITHRFRWMLMLVASYVFYMSWKPEYILLIVGSTLIDYFAGYRMSGIPEKAARRPYLYSSLLANFGLLFSFKYFDFFNESAKVLFEAFDGRYPIGALELILPVGISFYTFQTVSYTIDVYNGTTKAEKHLGIFALFVAFFPQLVAGPIERSSHLLPQFRVKVEFDYERIRNGLMLMAWGYFKKVVIADRLAVFVNQVYNNPDEFTGLQLIVATVFFAYQIYCDFSAYSDIAVGLAQVLGFDLMRNFNHPYASQSFSEFWKRWHISLSSWFRDYVYIPLGGNRVIKWRWFYNLAITFLLSGLWHGANWTFAIWGGLHALYLIGEILLSRSKLVPSLPGWTKVPIIFALTSFAWIFFRANSVDDAFLIISKLFDWKIDQVSLAMINDDSYQFVLAIIFLIVLECVQVIQRSGPLRPRIAAQPAWVRWSLYAGGTCVILFFGVFTEQEFIYFQF
ncbi:MAG: MBOAT family protein [Verrucomicrobia bacterium]|nr:MBOAT family protein [Verrucomicrobiota bacterium]